jgi:hypothetical protein
MTAISLSEEWLAAKEEEKAAIEKRREVEDKLIKLFSIDDTQEGTVNHEVDGAKIKVTARITRSVDSELLQEIAAENGLTDHLSTLFRWKPELNLKVWKNTDDSITQPLLGAITSKPSRPSFSITLED